MVENCTNLICILQQFEYVDDLLQMCRTHQNRLLNTVSCKPATKSQIGWRKRESGFREPRAVREEAFYCQLVFWFCLFNLISIPKNCWKVTKGKAMHKNGMVTVRQKGMPVKRHLKDCIYLFCIEASSLTKKSLFWLKIHEEERKHWTYG